MLTLEERYFLILLKTSPPAPLRQVSPTAQRRGVTLRQRRIPSRIDVCYSLENDLAEKQSPPWTSVSTSEHLCGSPSRCAAAPETSPPAPLRQVSPTAQRRGVTLRQRRIPSRIDVCYSLENDLAEKQSPPWTSVSTSEHLCGSPLAAQQPQKPLPRPLSGKSRLRLNGEG
ncbi:hypothetical protein SAMN05444359_13925 [Neolewinella agarilytica]|uniref:Uncharacterized protein n=1 Tax=Neolewinella agarilytica TaxID=478744 RepID=A0A1H9NSP8_9BACT|nr:hypothetical protein SAMN05444359_13925 [Neolewinella agarilytica]